jgi:hypothetical protein
MATKLSNEIIAAAIQGYEAQKQQIDAKLDELRGLLSSPGVGATAAAPRKRRKRRLSPEGRRRIIEATKRRWAAVRAAKEGKRSAAAKG